MAWRQLVLASKNPGKISELQALFAGTGIEVVGLDPASPDVEETGDTFEENAMIKARAACKATGLPALGEDSGIVVDALHGQPGVRSARWVPGSDADRMYALLERMEGVPKPKRTGRYVSCIAVVTPSGTERIFGATMDGTVGHEPRGTGGFGYDPIFIVGGGRTVAELSLAEKNKISHRAKALAKVMAHLPELLEDK